MHSGNLELENIMQRRELAVALFAASTVAASSKGEAQTCAAPCWPQTTLESAASVMPYQTQYLPGDIRRYYSGSGDYTIAIQNALKIAQDVYIPACLSSAPWVISSTLDVTVSNGAHRRIYGDGTVSYTHLDVYKRQPPSSRDSRRVL